MSFPGNLAPFINTANPRLASGVHALYQGTAAATGTFSCSDGVTGDIEFRIAGLSGETVGVTISWDGTNYSAALKPIDMATGLDAAAATLGNGVYSLPMKRFGSPRYVKFTKSSTSETVAVMVVAFYAVPSFVGI